MYKEKKIIAIIPARGGSKRLVNKNIKNLNGKPLIEWTINSALSSKLLDKIHVSTDSENIKKVSINCGLDVLFMRPSALAKDTSPTWETVIHVLEKFKKIGDEFDYVALLEPTSPLRKKKDIDESIKKIIDNSDAETLVSLGKIQLEHPLISKKLDYLNYVKPYINKIKKIHQSQQLDKAYFPYGVIYLSKVEVFYKKKTFYTNKTIPYHIDRWQNYEIDDLLDFNIIEYIMKKIR